MAKQRPKQAKRGPKPEVIRADGVDWRDAMKHALSKTKPKEGWPKPDDKSKAREG